MRLDIFLSVSDARELNLKGALLMIRAPEISGCRTTPLCCVCPGDPAPLPKTSERSPSQGSPRSAESHPRQGPGGTGPEWGFCRQLDTKVIRTSVTSAKDQPSCSPVHENAGGAEGPQVLSESQTLALTNTLTGIRQNSPWYWVS